MYLGVMMDSVKEELLKNKATGIIIAEVMIVMNPISIDHDVMVKRKITGVTFDLERRSTCTIENLGVNTNAVLTTLSCVRLG